MTTGDGVYETMIDCFVARETLVAEVGGLDGIPPNNMQAICIANDPTAGSPTFPL